MKICKNIVVISLLFLLTACSNSGMTMEKKSRLIISNDETFISVNTPYAKTQRVNLGPLYVDQHIIAADKNRCIVYEDIRTSSGHRFNYSYKRSIDLIFNAAKVEELNKYGNLTLYRLTLRDQNRSALNLLALTTSKKSLKLLYGFDESERTTLQKGLEHNVSAQYDVTAAPDNIEECIKSNWQPKLLIMDNLIGKEGGGHIVKPK